MKKFHPAPSYQPQNCFAFLKHPKYVGFQGFCGLFRHKNGNIYSLRVTNGHVYAACVTTEPSNEGNLSLGFIQLRTHQHLQRNTTNAWYLTSTCDTNDQAKQCNSTRHVIKQCNSARHVIRLISGGIETKPSHSPPVKLYGPITKTIRGLSNSC